MSDLATMGVAGTAFVAAAGAVVKALRDSGKQQAQIEELQKEKTELSEKLEKANTSIARCVTSEEFGAFSRMMTGMLNKQTGEIGRLAGIAESIRPKK